MINPDMQGMVGRTVSREDLVAEGVAMLLRHRANALRTRFGGGDVWSGEGQHPWEAADEMDQLAKDIEGMS